MQKLNAHKLVKECTRDFPYRIALITYKSHDVLELPSYDLYANEDDDSHILIMCDGLISIPNKNGQKMKCKRWSYDIFLTESTSTKIEVSVQPENEQKYIKVSSETYPTSEVFKFFPSFDRYIKSV